MSFIFLSVLASSLANLKFLFLSICYILPFFSMNIPLLTTPSLVPSRIVVVWDCKNRFFCIHSNTLANFFLLFLHFLYNTLITNEIKLHFFRFLTLFLPKKTVFWAFFNTPVQKISQIFGKFLPKSNFSSLLMASFLV